MEQSIEVSVVCTTFNQEKYLRKALDGIVMQKTSFAFEVIVHDDASIDNTPIIIKEYSEKYPFIKPLYQKENQYSKGIDISSTFVFPLIKGKYVAFCEGDDYWTDSNKLQILYDFMKNHNDCSMCCHAYNNIDANSEQIVNQIRTCDGDSDISVEQAILYNNPPQLASQMFRKDVCLQQPKLFLNRGVGDYTLLLYSAVCGSMHYINKAMANHRILSDSSWSKTVYKTKSGKIAHSERMISFLEDYNSYTNHVYDAIISVRINHFKYIIDSANFDYRLIIKNDEFKKQSLKRRFFCYLGCVFPHLFKMIETIIR